jgi:hypothetical protein
MRRKPSGIIDYVVPRTAWNSSGTERDRIWKVSSKRMSHLDLDDRSVFIVPWTGVTSRRVFVEI